MTVMQKGKNSKWYCEFMIDGIRYYKACKGATSKKEAQQYENVLKSDIMRGDLRMIDKSKKKITLKEAIELYLDYSKTNKRSYQLDENYCSVIFEEFKNIPLADLTPQKIEDFKTRLIIGRKPATVNRYLEAMSKMFNLCIDYDYIQFNPMKKVKKLKQENHKIRFLTKEEESRMFEHLEDGYLKNMIICALQTGMRREEIFSLKWANIGDGYIELLKTKTNKARKIPISSKLKAIFDSVDKTNEYIFINPYTKKPFTNVDKAFRKLKSNASIENFCFHDLRHTVATRMVEKGIDLLVVKDILGHTSINTTMRYAHPVPENKQKAVEILSCY